LWFLLVIKFAEATVSDILDMC